MTSKATSRTYIVAPMHRIAEVYAFRQGMLRTEFVTVTESRSLRGLSPDTPIILLDSTLRFQDSSLIPLLRQRFTNVREQKP